MVLNELTSQFKAGSIITFLAGEKYVKPLYKPLLQHGYKLSTPLKGKSIGKRVQWLNHANKSNICLKHLDRLYDLLNRVITHNGATIKTLEQYLSEKHTFKRGVYFFYNPNETRATHLNQARIVRVGTHAVSRGSKSTILDRLRQHRGTLVGLGNHRGSIFRLHVGRSILNQNPNQRDFLNWGKGQNASKQIRDSEADLEKQVSEHIGKLFIIGVEVDDDPGPASDRAFIERNAIGLLSKAAQYFDSPSERWLGQFSDRNEIRDSGLWNINHVGFTYDPEFLNILEIYVNSTNGEIDKPFQSVAPVGWHKYAKLPTNANQIILFQEGDA